MGDKPCCMKRSVESWICRKIIIIIIVQETKKIQGCTDRQRCFVSSAHPGVLVSIFFFSFDMTRKCGRLHTLSSLQQSVLDVGMQQGSYSRVLTTARKLPVIINIFCCKKVIKNKLSRPKKAGCLLDRNRCACQVFGGTDLPFTWYMNKPMPKILGPWSLENSSPPLSSHLYALPPCSPKRTWRAPQVS